jgi:hypothetical protein
MPHQGESVGRQPQEPLIPEEGLVSEHQVLDAEGPWSQPLDTGQCALDSG